MSMTTIKDYFSEHSKNYQETSTHNRFERK